MTNSGDHERLTDRELELRKLLMTDFEAYARGCLFIRTKRGEVQRFRLNASQRYLHERLQKQLREKGRIRALVLKGRQVGISTYISGHCIGKRAIATAFGAFILAHLDDASQNLFDMARRFHDNCPSP